MNATSRPASTDTLRVGLAFLVARLVRSGVLSADLLLADLQLTAAVLLAQVEPGSPAFAPGGGDDDPDGYADDVSVSIADLAGPTLAALAVPAPDTPWSPPEPPPATLAALDALAGSGAPLPPFLRARVMRGEAEVGMLVLVPAAFLPPAAPGGWYWRSLAPGVSSPLSAEATPAAGPLAAAVGGQPSDEVTLLYPAVPVPP